MKKNDPKKLICITVVALSLFCGGCALDSVPRDIITPDAHALTVSFEGVSGSGIGPGSTWEEWVSAYGSYHIQEATDEGFVPYDPAPELSERSKHPDKITPHNASYMVSAFYIDDEPADVETLITELGISADELNDYLSSPEYLAEHTVVYRYIIFNITDDIVTDLESDYLDYNTEL